jgi:hypothetical protein
MLNEQSQAQVSHALSLAAWETGSFFLDQQNLGFNPEFCAIFTRKKGG